MMESGYLLFNPVPGLSPHSITQSFHEQELLAGYFHLKPIITGITDNQKPGFLGHSFIIN